MINIIPHSLIISRVKLWIIETCGWICTAGQIYFRLICGYSKIHKIHKKLSLETIRLYCSYNRKRFYYIQLPCSVNRIWSSYTNLKSIYLHLQSSLFALLNSWILAEQIGRIPIVVYPLPWPSYHWHTPVPLQMDRVPRTGRQSVCNSEPYELLSTYSPLCWLIA